jgi:hypothetical protein
VPALTGGVVSTIYDATGPVFIVSQWYDPATGNLRDQATSTANGTKTGALVVDNRTGRTQRVTVTNPETGTVKTFTIPATGTALTVAQLAAIPPPDGPVTTIHDLAGLSPSLT